MSTQNEILLDKLFGLSAALLHTINKNLDSVNEISQGLIAHDCSSPMKDLGCDEVLDSSGNSHEKGSTTMSHDETEAGKRNKTCKSMDHGDPSQGHAVSDAGLGDNRGNACADELPPLSSDHDTEREWLLTTRTELRNLEWELAEYAMQFLGEMKEEESALAPHHRLCIKLREAYSNRLELLLKPARPNHSEDVATAQVLQDIRDEREECHRQLDAQHKLRIERTAQFLSHHKRFTLQLSEMHDMMDYLENAETSATA